MRNSLKYNDLMLGGGGWLFPTENGKETTKCFVISRKYIQRRQVAQSHFSSHSFRVFPVLSFKSMEKIIFGGGGSQDLQALR